MCALAIEPRSTIRPSACSITIVDPGGAVFQRLRQGVSADLGAALALVSAQRALDWDADLRIVILAPLRDWAPVAISSILTAQAKATGDRFNIPAD